MEKHQIPGAVLRSVIALSLLLCSLASAHGQLNIQKVYGNPCVGTSITFVLMGPGTINNWQVMGTDYTIVSGGGTSTMITVKWDTPQNSAGVMAFGPQGSGSAWVNIGGGHAPLGLDNQQCVIYL